MKTLKKISIIVSITVIVLTGGIAAFVLLNKKKGDKVDL